MTAPLSPLAFETLATLLKTKSGWQASSSVKN